MKTAINTVVPHPGKTLPDSEFNGLKRVPKGVTIPGSCKVEEVDGFFVVAIVFFLLDFFLLSVIFFNNFLAKLNLRNKIAF